MRTRCGFSEFHARMLESSTEDKLAARHHDLLVKRAREAYGKYEEYLRDVAELLFIQKEMERRKAGKPPYSDEELDEHLMMSHTDQILYLMHCLDEVAHYFKSNNLPLPESCPKLIKYIHMKAKKE